MATSFDIVEYIRTLLEVDVTIEFHLEIGFECKSVQHKIDVKIYFILWKL